MSISKLLIFVAVAAFTAPILHGEKHCPGNVPSVPLNVVLGALIVVPVTVNGIGPFEFLVDTGAQITTVDSQLAAQLDLRPTESTGFSGVASYARRALLQLGQMEIGGHRANNVLAVIDQLTQLHAADRNIRGIAGEDFLTHFDLLIDNDRRMLCLDESGAMAAAVKGAHVALAQPYGTDHDLPFTRPLVVEARIDGNGNPLLFRLDSGSNAPVVYGRPQAQNNRPANTQILKRVVDGVEQDFAVLKPHDVAVGRDKLHQVTFVQPLNSVGEVRAPREDGVLPTFMFQTVFVSYRNQFAILEPR